MACPSSLSGVSKSIRRNVIQEHNLQTLHVAF